MNIIPYVKKIESEWSVPEESIKSLFYRMEKEEKASAVFHDGLIVTAEQFMEYMQSPGNLLYIIMTGSGSCGFFWLNCFDAKSARIHFCSFGGFPRDVLLMEGREAVRTIMGFKGADGRNMLDSLTGVIPARNKVAWSFLHDLGFEKVGIHPCGAYIAETGESEDSVIFCMTKYQAEKI